MVRGKDQQSVKEVTTITATNFEHTEGLSCDILPSDTQKNRKMNDTKNRKIQAMLRTKRSVQMIKQIKAGTKEQVTF
jgi:hypothetical protein